ncbi:MAG TPA: DUF3382 domain-containing protein, partial [Geminicoccaceae bacterium]|nr:DUF3382 domain-containing protein [Geminicoccaceae bacterium]
MAGRVLAERVAAPARIDWPAALKEAALAALVAFVLFLPLIGMQTINIEGGLGLRFRFNWVLIGTAAVFAGRLLLIGALSLPTSFVTIAAAPFRQIPGLISPYRRLLAFAGILFAFIMPFLPFANRYVVDIGTTVLIYVMLGWGLNIVVGLAGLLDLGYVAFYAVGAYSFALFAHWFELGFWECLPLAGALAASFGILLGFPVLRLRGDYLAIVTLGFGEIVRIVLNNADPLTRGPNGIASIPDPSFFGLNISNGVKVGGVELADNAFYFYLLLALIALALT